MYAGSIVNVVVKDVRTLPTAFFLIRGGDGSGGDDVCH